MDIKSEPVPSHPLGPTPEPGPLANLADITADLAARCAFTAAVDAADAVGYSESIASAALDDYQKILGLDLGVYPDAGQPVDPSSDGPLGPVRPA
jgi:hypothetical protein